MDERTQQGPAPDMPFVVPCARLEPGAPLRWLAAGWRDWRKAPGLSLLFGGGVFLISVGVSLLAYQMGSFLLLAAVLSGFIFFAPLLAVGLYDVARQHEQGGVPGLGSSWRLVRRIIGQTGVFALVQIVILMIWSRSGMVLNALFRIEQGELDVIIQFLLVGSAIGCRVRGADLCHGSVSHCPWSRIETWIW